MPKLLRVQDPKCLVCYCDLPRLKRRTGNVRDGSYFEILSKLFRVRHHSYNFKRRDLLPLCFTCTNLAEDIYKLKERIASLQLELKWSIVALQKRLFVTSAVSVTNEENDCSSSSPSGSEIQTRTINLQNSEESEIPVANVEYSDQLVTVTAHSNVNNPNDDFSDCFSGDLKVEVGDIEEHQEPQDYTSIITECEPQGSLARVEQFRKTALNAFCPIVLVSRCPGVNKDGNRRKLGRPSKRHDVPAKTLVMSSATSDNIDINTAQNSRHQSTRNRKLPKFLEDTKHNITLKNVSSLPSTVLGDHETIPCEVTITEDTDRDTGNFDFLRSSDDYESDHDNEWVRAPKKTRRHESHRRLLSKTRNSKVQIKAKGGRTLEKTERVLTGIPRGKPKLDRVPPFTSAKNGKIVFKGINVLVYKSGSIKCSKCEHLVEKGNQSSMRKLMRAHIMTEHLDGFRCEHCRKRFETSESLNNHLKWVHPVNDLVPCDICGKPLRYKSLRGHRWDHKSEEEKAAAIAAGEVVPYNYRRIYPTEKTHQCQECGKMFKTKGSLTSHEQTHSATLEQRKVHLCAFCGKLFTSLIGLNAHRLEVHEKHTIAKWYYCTREDCKAKFSNNGHLNRHIRIMHEGVRKYSCTVCPKTFYAKSHLTKHLITHTDERPYACPKCGSTYRSPDHLRRHNENAHLGIPQKKYDRKKKLAKSKETNIVQTIPAKVSLITSVASVNPDVPSSTSTIATTATTEPIRDAYIHPNSFVWQEQIVTSSTRSFVNSQPWFGTWQNQS